MQAAAWRVESAERLSPDASCILRPVSCVLHLVVSCLFLLIHTTSSLAASDLKKEIERRPGDIDGAIRHLEAMLTKHYRGDIFAAFSSRVHRPSADARYAATRILALQRMGKLSVHSAAVKRAFSYEFNTSRTDPTRRHETLALYRRFAVPNTDDPYWRMIRARCARLLDLPETLQLYEQVEADMSGVPPSDELKGAWKANGKEFPLADFTKESWARQSRFFIADAKGVDVPGSPPIKGSPYPYLDIKGSVGARAKAWTEALEGSALTNAGALDKMASECKECEKLAWLNGRGFLNAERALSLHLQSTPAKELGALRTLQEMRFKKETRRGSDAKKALTLFRRFPLSESAQRLLLQSARQHLFLGESHAAFRCYEDVLRLAETRDVIEQAQVGLWVSMSQFTEPEVLAKTFDGVKSDATWPWFGKRETTDVIKRRLVTETPTRTESPSLESLRVNTIHIPPLRMPGPGFSIDMQSDNGQLLVSSEGALTMYSISDPGKPLWILRRKARRSGFYLPPIVGEKVITRWLGDNVGDYAMLALNRRDGTVVAEGNAHDPYSRYVYWLTGSPVVADNKVFAVQSTQDAKLRGKMHQEFWWGDVTLSCFQAKDMASLWTRIYGAARTTGLSRTNMSVDSRPAVSEGAVYFCSNAGHVIRADIRDGEMEWIHFYRRASSPQHPAEWRLGGTPIVTADKVICMPKLPGHLFALDKETGRRIWTLPFVEGNELLGRYEDLVLVVGPNSLIAVDVDTGRIRWGRQLSKEYVEGFQLPRAQLIGSSVYTGTKKMLYRFDARNGFLLESRPWKLGKESPMSFLVDDKNVHVISDHPMRDEAMDRQLAQYYTTILRATGYRHRGGVYHLERKDGSQLFWLDSMLTLAKKDKLIWSRFVSISHYYQCKMSDRGKHISLSASGAVYDARSGELKSMSSRSGKIVISGR